MHLLPNPSQQNDHRRLIIAVLICGMLFVGLEYLRIATMTQPEPIENIVETTVDPLQPELLTTETVLATVAAPIPATAESQVLNLENTLYTAQVDITARLSQLTIKGTEKTANWFQAQGLQKQYLETGWLGQGVPPRDAAWQAIGPNQLQYTSENGLVFTRTFTLGENYQVQIEDTVTNPTTENVTLQHYTQLVRGFEQLENEFSQWLNVFGPLALQNDVLVETSYKDLREQDVVTTTQGGWLGFSTQYYGTFLLAPSETETLQRFRHTEMNNQNVYTALLQQPAVIIPTGGSQTIMRQIYIGPKSELYLPQVRPDLARAVNYGWFDVLASPMHQVLMWLHQHLGNWGLAIIGLTLLLKIITFPLTYKSFAAMAKLKTLQPDMQKLQEKYTGEDAPENGREQMAREMMALYQKHKVSPLSGCWPVLIQIPIFFAMYKLILMSYELNGAPFILWINDLAVMDPYFVLPVLMGASMWLQMQLNPQMGDPLQQKIMQWLPVIFTVFFLWFPSGLVLYWLTNNVFAIAQQYWMLRRAGVINTNAPRVK